MTTPALLTRLEPGAHHMGARDRRRRWSVWVVAAAVLLTVGSAFLTGLPGRGRLQVKVDVAGGQVTFPGGAYPGAGPLVVTQGGREVETIDTARPTLLPVNGDFSGTLTLSLHPGVYRLHISNYPSCGATAVVLWHSTRQARLTCTGRP